ncbi:ATP-binding protein [Nocardioides euryhalodurans]|uniref:ATP-binding protein n=1 Tax=Nocardioides euryhalodurans TaxID=2518370 RepID=UPI00141F9505|nr:AAA family ATPase [Nocardioides euryhalodurans]
MRLLGGFDVSVDGVAVPPSAWARRQAAALVKLLAVSEQHRLHREQVMDALWPGLRVEAAAPRLHKAAHYARRALGDGPEAVLLRHDLVALLPTGELSVDVEDFLRAGREAMAQNDARLAEQALASCPSGLLPEDRYEPWTDGPRGEVEALRKDLHRLAGRWADLVRLTPTDEEAHVALARQYADRGDVRGALRQLERLDRSLRRELGTAPGPEAVLLREQLEAAGPTPAVPPQRGRSVRLVGRRDLGDQIRSRLDRSLTGRGGSLVLTGPAGVGKSALLDLTESLARRRGFRTGRGSAAAVEGPWPYAPVLEALGDLCRKHPALLDGLGDDFRLEIERALSGQDLDWSGESGHQRLFVAVAELVRLAAAGHGLLIGVDDLHEVDDASMRLLHYLSRCASSEPVLLVMAGRPLTGGTRGEILDSLLSRDVGAGVEVRPLSTDAIARLLREVHPRLSPDLVERIADLSGGLPFTALELARRQGVGENGDVVPPFPVATLRTFRRLALLGMTFSTDELLTMSEEDEETAYAQLDLAVTGRLVEQVDGGHRFRHPLLREALVDQLTASERVAEQREVAARLSRLDGPPTRVAHLFVAAGRPALAVPFVLQAVETAGALGAYRDALALIGQVVDHAGPAHRPHLLSRRGDLLMAVGDPAAVEAYRAALPLTSGSEHRLVRARMARAATSAGDLETARAALAGLELEGDVADGPILLGRGNLAYFSGDVDGAWEIAGRAREMLPLAHDQWQLMDLVSLQGLIAHQRGEWFERFRMEMRRTQGRDRLATSVFDAHLCVAEYLLYGPVPYAEVMAETEELRRRATQAGALRGVAFATALIGEAALLKGDLDRAEQELAEAVELHREIDATAGEAHSLQRLAEVRLALGDREDAVRLLHQALPLARWSVISLHLLQRVYGTMISAAPDAVAARAVVDRAEATMGDQDRCPLCDVMFAVPAAIACADVSDVEDARRHLAVAEQSASRWAGTAWEASVLEARAHLAGAEGRHEEAAALIGRAELLFEVAGQQRDASRCRRGVALATRGA